jgi:hypothetical protein
MKNDYEKLLERLRTPWTMEPAQDPIAAAKNELNALVQRFLSGDRTAGLAAAEAQHELERVRKDPNNQEKRS